jgi:hypothetical protein
MSRKGVGKSAPSLISRTPLVPLVTKSLEVSPGGEARQVGLDRPDAIRTVVIPSPWAEAEGAKQAKRKRGRRRIKV